MLTGGASYLGSRGKHQGQVGDSGRRALFFRVGASRTVGFTCLGTPNFSVTTGMPLLVAASGAAPATVAWVGGVPDQGTGSITSWSLGVWNLHYAPLDKGYRPTHSRCDGRGYRGGVTQGSKVERSPTQSWVIRTVLFPGWNPPRDFAVSIGYPYLVSHGRGQPGRNGHDG